jgi:hypothetical protein
MEMSGELHAPAALSPSFKFIGDWVDPKSSLQFRVKKGKAVPVPGHGGPYGYETLRVPQYLDNRLTDGGKGVSLTRRPPFTPQEGSWYSFLLEAESTPGP